MIRLFRAPFVAVLAAVLTSSAALAADYPVRPVKWVVPYAPAGTTDVLARIVAQWLTERMGTEQSNHGCLLSMFLGRSLLALIWR